MINAQGATLDFAAVLLGRAKDGALRKTERTRLRLLASIARELMEGTQRADLKVAAITQKAGLAHGTFYRYFTDGEAAVSAVIEDFSTFVQERLSADRAIEAGPRERVRTATLLFARLFRRNAGLMRCLLGFGGENAAFATSYQKLNRDWYKRVATAIARERGADASSADLLPAAYALGGMIDDFLAQIYLRKVPALAHLAQDEEKIADLLTDMWCFGAYGRQTLE